MQPSKGSPQTLWSEHIKHWQASDLSQAAYCRQEDLDEQQFSYWKRKLSKTRQPQPSQPAFSQVNIQPPVQVAMGLSLQLPNGFRIDGINQNNLVIINELIGRLK